MVKKTARAGGQEVHVHVRGGREETPAPARPVSSVLDAADYDDAIDAVPEGTMIKLYKFDDQGTRALVTEAAATALRESAIARYGPGVYIAAFRGRVNDGTRRMVFKGERRVTVSEAAALDAKPAAAIAPAPAAAAGAPPAPAALMEAALLQFLSMMAQQQREHSTLVVAMIEKLGRRPEETANPLLMAILPKLLERGNVDPIEQAARIAEIGAKSSTRSNLSDVTAYMELIDRLKERTGESEVPWYAGIVKEAVPLIRGQHSEAVATATAAPAAANGQVSPAIASEQQPPALPSSVQMIGQFIPDIVRGAMSGKDAHLVADWIAAEIPPGLYPTVRRILETPGVTDQVCASYPELAPMQPYVEEVRAALVTALADEEPGGE